MASSSAQIMLSRWLGAAWEECGLNLNIIVNPEGAVAGGCKITALLAAEQKVLSWGNPNGEPPWLLQSTPCVMWIHFFLPTW